MCACRHSDSDISDSNSPLVLHSFHCTSGKEGEKGVRAGIAMRIDSHSSSPLVGHSCVCVVMHTSKEWTWKK